MDTLPADRRRAERLWRSLAGDDGIHPRVHAALIALPRHAFIPPEFRSVAYEDRPIAIGCGQTISQPRVVGRMLSLLDLQPGQAVIDIGAGSGYAAALIDRLVQPGGRVHAIERQGALIATSKARLAVHAPLVELVHGDGLCAGGSWDRLHCAACVPGIPAAWLDAVRPGGRLIAPVGAVDGHQYLMLGLRALDGEWAWEQHEAVCFVPGLDGIEEAPCAP